MPHNTHTLLVADSFRVRANPQSSVAEVRGLEHHLARFSEAAAAATAHTLTGLSSFLSQARAQISGYGPGFPRWELWASPDHDFDLRLRLRPLPELQQTVELVSRRLPAPAHANRKGPHLDRYAALSRALQAEVLLTDSAGTVREGGTTALIWWVGEQGFTVAGKDRVPSVTERLLRQISLAAGQPFASAQTSPAQLQRAELWAVNALHGIRVVTRLDGVALPAAQQDRLGYFGAALDRTWQVVG